MSGRSAYSCKAITESSGSSFPPVVLRLGEASHLHLPGSDFTLIKQDAGSSPEMLIAINGLVAAPAEVCPAAAADHVAAARCLLYCHLAGGALLCAFLHIRPPDHLCCVGTSMSLLDVVG